MQMSSRVRRSWGELVASLDAAGPAGAMTVFRAWVPHSLARVSRAAAERIGTSDAIRRLALGNGELATSRLAIRDVIATWSASYPLIR